MAPTRRCARRAGHDGRTRPARPPRRATARVREQQRNVPALVIPIRDVTGTIGNYQSKPDVPRIGQQGKPVKYETPARSQTCLDVPPRVRPALGDPTADLLITTRRA